MQRLEHEESGYLFENRCRDKNGHYIYLSWSFIKNESANLIYASAQDITNIKLIEADKKEKEKLFYQQSKMAAMGEMIGNIAHQWRQPLSTISITATGAKLQKQMNCLPDEKLNSALTAINNTAQYLSRTIDDFRDFFNPSNSKVNEFNISDTFNKTFNLIKAQFISKNIEIIQNIEDFNLLSIENELIQVLINILNNARDVLITKMNQRRLIFVNTKKNDSNIVIEIKDNAGGIPEDIMDRIFEPYFTTKHQSQGTGIGLYMSEEIIKTHLNGILSVQNAFYVHDEIEYTGAKFVISISNINHIN